MENNVVAIGGKMARNRKAKIVLPNPSLPLPENVEVMPVPDTENLTPQQLLALLSMNKNIASCIVIFPMSDFSEESLESTHVMTANLSIADANWLLDKAKIEFLLE